MQFMEEKSIFILMLIAKINELNDQGGMLG